MGVTVTTRTEAVTVPYPITAGPEMVALRRFFRDCTWKGTIVEGGMGPGTPAMSAEGRGVYTPIQDGRWIVGTAASRATPSPSRRWATARSASAWSGTSPIRG